jgi:hypothetical protein
MRILFTSLLALAFCAPGFAVEPVVAAPTSSCKVPSRWGTAAQFGALASTVAGLSLGTAVGLSEGSLDNAAAPLFNLGYGSAAVGFPLMVAGGVGMLATGKKCNKHATIAGVSLITAGALAVPAGLLGRPFVSKSVEAGKRSQNGTASVNGAVALVLFAVPISAMFVGLRHTGQMRNVSAAPVTANGQPGLTVAGRF